jgi:fused signal recognition particle receptor
MNIILEFLPVSISLIIVFYFLFFSKASSSQKVDAPKVDAVKAETPQVNKVEEPKTKAKVEVSFSQRLQKGLSKTRSDIWKKVGGLLGQKSLSDEIVEELEEILFASDMSPSMVAELLDELQNNYDPQKDNYLKVIKNFMLSNMENTQNKINLDLYDFTKKQAGTKVIMIVGVNGAGKTTTIGKLATKLKAQGAKVVVGACDTFRAAAVEQLQVWCDRAGVDMIRAEDGANPSGVAYETVEKAKAMNADYCLIDTAGRLHTASNLMDELAKTKKVMGKVIDTAPHEVLLVIDAITGQNALRQAQEFNKALDLTGLIFTKCDGSSKAGSAVSIVKDLNVPIAYIGVGESVEDLDIFNLNSYLDALLGTGELVE